MTTRRSFRIALIALAALFVVACESSPSAPDASVDDALMARASAKPDKKDNNGKRPKEEEPTVDPEPAPEYVWYRVAEYDEFDKLFRFGIDGDMALLETDPSHPVATWGSDNYGYWTDPFPYVDGVVYYVVGLSEVTYTFTPLPEGGFDVDKKVVMNPYLGGEPTTTEKHVGIFRPEG